MLSGVILVSAVAATLKAEGLGRPAQARPGRARQALGSAMQKTA